MATAVHSPSSHRERVTDPAGRHLILHGDDLGMAHSINEATFTAMESGALSSCSVMMVCPWAPEVVGFARKHPMIDIGIHFTLTSEWAGYRWGPVAARAKVPSLCDPQGYLWPDVASVVAHAESSEVEHELRAQVERALRCGFYPTHIDAHMGFLLASEKILHICLGVAEDYDLPVAIGTTMNEAARGAGHATATTQSHTSQAPDPLRLYVRALENLRSGVNLAIVHLGYDNAELQSITAGHEIWGSAWRQEAFNVITGAAFKKALERSDVTLTGWWNVRPLLTKRVRDAGHESHQGSVPCGAYKSCLGQCNRTLNVGVGSDIPEAIDWTHRDTTIDQLRIESALSRLDLSNKALLHVGVGNSGLAQRFVERLAHIDGLTLSPGEKSFADSLRLERYLVYPFNKYEANLSSRLPRRYDFVVDNNLASYACCQHHFRTMMRNYAELLTREGQVLTDQRGMDWTFDVCGPQVDARWRLSYADLLVVAAEFSFTLSRITNTVYALRSNK